MPAHLDIKKLSWAGFLISVGIVYGDIGTSPLYTFKAIIQQNPVNIDLVLGSVSAIFWTLTFQTTLKYVLITLKADNRGEGGIFSLYALIRRYGKWLMIPALLGGSFLIADSIITPPISVSSAIEGLKMQYPDIPVIPIVLAIICLLFLIQPLGTSKIGKIFGPAMMVWFTMIGVMGLYSMLQMPSVIKALNPIYAWRFISDYPGGFWLLGGVFLCTTGAEALYSDLGHCGRKNIEISWIYIKTCLVLCYLGQAAWLVQHENMIMGNLNAFFAMMPSWMFWPAIVVATLAAIIASQALISGTFTLFNEAMRLNFFPKLTVFYPSEVRGQLYIPAVNWALLAACCGVVLFFKESANMEAAYGLSVTLTMLMTTILLSIYLMYLKKTARVLVILMIGIFLIVESSFLLANLQKFTHGGYVTLIFGLFLFWIMFTWQWAGKVKERVLRFVSLKKHVPALNALSNDFEIPKYATHLVYFTNFAGTDKVEEEIMRSIYFHQPKRADVYWLLHIKVTDEPYTSGFKTETLEPNELMRVTYYLGFRVVPHVDLLFKKVLSELYGSGEFATSDTWKIFYKHNPAGDYRFIVLENYLSQDNDLPMWKKIPLRIYYFLKKLDVTVEEAYNLDYSLVTTEKVPLLVESPNLIKLKKNSGRRDMSDQNDKEKRVEQFLELNRKTKVGKLKIYLGMSAGVGKTYRMLQEVHTLLQNGVNVKVGYVETHGRKETQALIEGLPLIPRREIFYKGKRLEELDVQAILLLHPQVVIIDELAHSNIPGSKNEKRWQDVLDVLDAGIDVISAVNIQHIESINEDVKEITGVEVKERIPDKMLQIADEVVNIDLTADELISRLKAGKIYDHAKVQQALQNFFQPDKILQLRELALKEVAGQVERKVDHQITAKQTPFRHERFLACVSSNHEIAQRIIRKTARLASYYNSQWYVLYVQSSKESADKIPLATQRHLINNFKNATELGGEVIQKKGQNIASAIFETVNEKGISTICLGKPHLNLWQIILRTSIFNQLLKTLSKNNVDLVILS